MNNYSKLNKQRYIYSATLYASKKYKKKNSFEIYYCTFFKGDIITFISIAKGIKQKSTNIMRPYNNTLHKFITKQTFGKRLISETSYYIQVALNKECL